MGPSRTPGGPIISLSRAIGTELGSVSKVSIQTMGHMLTMDVTAQESALYLIGTKQKKKV